MLTEYYDNIEGISFTVCPQHGSFVVYKHFSRQHSLDNCHARGHDRIRTMLVTRGRLRSCNRTDYNSYNFQFYPQFHLNYFYKNTQNAQAAMKLELCPQPHHLGFP
jgi:hypothetical protein